MQLRYDDDFVEGAVFLRAASRQLSPPSLQVRRFHREREKLYTLLDPDERNNSFFKLHLAWFQEWGLERALLAVVNEFPMVHTALCALAFRKARVKTDEGAELYVNAENSRIGVMALRVERFEQPDEMAGFLRHEFTHLHDMLNPAFGYSPQLVLPEQNAAQQRLTRERYRMLWDITIDGRLTNASRATPGSGELHRAAFERAFSFWPEQQRDKIFKRLWEDREPRHDDLLAIASDPRELKSQQWAAPGAPCPLCGFSTFAWTAPRDFCPETTAAIIKEFPHWVPAQGACRRCVEIYRSAGKPSPAIA